MAAQGTATVTSPNGQFTSPFSPTGGWADLMDPMKLLQEGGNVLNQAGAIGGPMTKTGSGGSPWNPDPTKYSSDPATGAPSPFTVQGNTPAAPLPKVGGMANDPTASAFYKMLQGDLQGASMPVTPDDPTISAQTTAFANAQTRGAKDILTQAAEKGGPYANMDAATLSAAEKAGANTASYQAGLMSDERNARRSEIQNLLSTGSSFLNAQQSAALQEELAQLDLQERAYEFGQNQDYLYSPFASNASA